MEDITSLLQQDGEIMTPWLAIVWLCAAFLIAHGVSVFAAPKAARRFLNSFASTIAVNTLEALLRFIAGLAFMAASTEMKFTNAYFLFGTILSVTAVFMLFLPKLHKHYAVWAIAFVMKILPLYGALSILLGGVVVYSLV